MAIKKQSPPLTPAQASVQIDPELVKVLHAKLDEWRRHMLAAVESVREDKRNLYLNPAVRWWIDRAQRWALIKDDPMGAKEFFQRLAAAVRAGVGRDKRMEKGFDWRPAEWVEYEVRKLRRAGWSYARIADHLSLEVEESQLRRWMNRRGRM